MAQESAVIELDLPSHRREMMLFRGKGGVWDST